MIEDINDNENNDKVVNSAYSKSLNRILQINQENCKNLENEIEDISNHIFNAVISIIPPLFTAPVLLSFSNLISTMIEIGIAFASIGTGIIITIKRNKKIDLKNKQLIVLRSINDYLESELEISKNNNNLLSNSQILNLEKIHIQNIENILYNNVQLEFLYDNYLEECRKNKIIIDSLERLDSKQKEECLKDIYIQMNENFIKTNIDINDNKNLLTANTINDLFSKTPLSQSKDLTQNQTGISLNKDSYNVPNYSYDDNGNMHVNGDILPPKAQEELEKGKQFSKKFPH